MSITDELRKYTEEQIKWLDMTKVHYRNLIAIADRIDAKHEEAIASMMNDALYHANDKDMADLGWVKLPKDADGEYIHVGDVMDSRVDYLFDGKPFTVRALVLCEDGWEVADGRFGNRYEPDSLRHHHEPTVEDVLRDMHAKLDEVTALYVGEAIDSDERDSDEARIFAKYAAKLRLAGDGE